MLGSVRPPPPFAWSRSCLHPYDVAANLQDNAEYHDAAAASLETAYAKHLPEFMTTQLACELIIMGFTLS